MDSAGKLSLLLIDILHPCILFIRAISAAKGSMSSRGVFSSDEDPAFQLQQILIAILSNDTLINIVRLSYFFLFLWIQTKYYWSLGKPPEGLLKREVSQQVCAIPRAWSSLQGFVLKSGGILEENSSSDGLRSESGNWSAIYLNSKWFLLRMERGNFYRD